MYLLRMERRKRNGEPCPFSTRSQILCRREAKTLCFEARQNHL